MKSELIITLISALPLVELNGALPVALEVFDFGLKKALLFSIIGNFLPVPIIIYFFDLVAKWLMSKSEIFKRFFEWLFVRTRNKFVKDHQRWGYLGLIVFVAIPIPGAGAWTASLASRLFDIPKKQSIFYIFIGILVASVVILGFTKGLKFLI